MSPEGSRHNSRSTPRFTSARLEAFSDGVIAVIITIMVLELHVPRGDGFAGLWSIAPQLGIYLLSFLIIGIYWVNHHDLIGRIEAVNYGVLWSNLVFLLALSLIPYFVDYLGVKAFDTFSTVLYDVIMLLAAATFFLLRRCVMQLQRQTGALHRTDMSELWKHLTSLAIYLVSIAVAFYRPWLSLVITGMVTFVWIIPGILVKPCDTEAVTPQSHR